MKYWGFLLCVFFIWSCKSPKSAVTKAAKQQKVEQKLLHKDYTIIFSAAYPQASHALNQAAQQLNLAAYGSSAAAIDISGNGYFLTVKKDSVSADLPFYGEQYTAGNMNAQDNGIEFSGKPNNHTIQRNEKYTRIKFTIADKNRTADIYSVSLKIYPNGTADLIVSSIQRSVMSFRGNIKLSVEKD